MDKLSWLAGFIDGEGCITSYPKFTKGAGYSIVVNTQISSTSRETLEFASSVMLGAIGLSAVGLNEDKRGGRKSDAYYLAVNRREDNLKLLEALEPCLVTKRREAQLAAQFLRSRLARGVPRNERGQRLAVPYSRFEVDLAIELKRLSNRLRTEEEVELLFASVQIE